MGMEQCKSAHALMDRYAAATIPAEKVNAVTALVRSMCPDPDLILATLGIAEPQTGNG